MAIDTSIVGEVGGQFIEKLFSGLLWFGIGIIIAGVLFFLIWWFLVYKKKFNIKVKVISERAEDRNRIFFDYAAILRDRKDKSKFFRLWGLKLDLPAPKFNVLQATDKGDYLELYRTSENKIYFLTPSVIDRTKVIKADGKIYSIASQTSRQIDPDMDFWGARRVQENKKLFDTDSMFMKLMPYIPAILGGIVTIFVLYILLDHLPGILSALTELVREMRSLKRADIIVGLLLLKCLKY